MGAKRTSRDHRESVVRDPFRHFTTVNYCTAKGLFDHLVGARKEFTWHTEAERIRSFDVDPQLDPRGLFHRQVGTD